MYEKFKLIGNNIRFTFVYLEIPAWEIPQHVPNYAVVNENTASLRTKTCYFLKLNFNAIQNNTHKTENENNNIAKYAHGKRRNLSDGFAIERQMNVW